MNNKKSFFFVALFAFLVLVSCRKALQPEVFTVSSEKIQNCLQVSCPEIDIEYIQMKDNSEAAVKINTTLKQFVIESLYIGESETGSTASTVEDAMANFIKLYRTHSAEFPDLAAEYFADVTVLPTYNSKHLVSISCSNYLYTGGAHGNGITLFHNFDPKTGKSLTYEDVFTNVAIFDAIAEETFRIDNEILANENINASGFWFENDTFSIPESFGISKEFVTLHYNPYEIAAYAAGPIIIEIPISEVKNILKIPIE